MMIKRNILPGRIIIIGYGSIGRGLLPLLEKHLDFKPEQFNESENNY